MSKNFIDYRGVAIASPGCCRSVRTPAGYEYLCPDPVAWVGTHTTTVGRQHHTDTVFACDGHEEVLDDRRPFGPDDEALLQRNIARALKWSFEPWPGFRESQGTGQ